MMRASASVRLTWSRGLGVLSGALGGRPLGQLSRCSRSESLRSYSARSAAAHANGVVIGMSVGRQIAYRHISVSGPFNAPGTENAVGITVNEQRQHQMGRILLVATPFVVDRKGGQRQPLDRGNHKMYQVVLRYPFAQVRRQKHGCIPVRILESLRHSCII